MAFVRDDYEPHSFPSRNTMDEFKVGMYVAVNKQPHKAAYIGEVHAIVDTTSSQFLVIKDFQGFLEYRPLSEVHVITNVPKP